MPRKECFFYLTEFLGLVQAAALSGLLNHAYALAFSIPYSTIFNIGFGPEEVVFMFGNPSIDPNLIRIESKVAVSLKTAKRIVNALGNLIQRYEAANGMLHISVLQAGEKIKT